MKKLLFMKRFLAFSCMLLLVCSSKAQTNRPRTGKSKPQTTIRKTGSRTSKTGKTAVSKPTTKAKSTTSFCPDDRHPHAIDLDLPTGTKWACCNVGASIPEEYGGYYAFGETKEKKIYGLENYKFCNERYKIHPRFDELPRQYDVAHIKMGGKWQMPTYMQCSELVNNCSFEWITIAGVSGAKFTGPNGNSIFLPASGAKSNNIFGRNEWGTYWPRTAAYAICFDYDSPGSNERYSDFSINSERGQVTTSGGCRYFGYSVRAVEE